eukprot:s1565_g12.t1
MQADATASRESEPAGSYGPIRRRVTGKNAEVALYRPPAMQEDDFAEMMRELVPRLIENATQSQPPSSGSPSSASQGTKRDRDTGNDDSTEGPPTVRSRVETNEVLYVEEVLDLWDRGGVEALMSAHLQKKSAKELPPSGNDAETQKLVDESKSVEWSTLIEKGAVRVHYGKKALHLRETQPDRFMGSRFVIIHKPVVEGQNVDLSDPSSFKIKSRWCLQGHLDPDLDKKALEGLLQSPTLSQMGRNVLMQVIASHRWKLQLGDIKGAFMEAGPLPAKYRPLYAHQPKGGIPGVPSDAVLEVVGNVYGQNNAPHAWYATFDAEALACGFVRSKFDSCLYYLRDDENRLQGILGVHVDDTAVGGEGLVNTKIWPSVSMRFLLPQPKIKHLRDVNNAIRRARQHKDLAICFNAISPDRLTVCCHSDAAWANVGLHTQAGFIIAFVDKSLHDGAVSPWSPVVWRSYKLPRAVSSTLGGEAQAMATAGGTVEWLCLLLAEALDGPFDPFDARSVMSRRPPVFATDCKSLFDHLISPSSP